MRKREEAKKPATKDFQFIAGNLALDFVNTVADRLGTPRDYFVSVGEFNRWASMRGLLKDDESLPLTAQQFQTIHGIREDLYHLFCSLTGGARPAERLLQRLNVRFSKVVKKRRLVVAGREVSWQWDMKKSDPDRALGPILLSATELLTSGLWRKIRQCDDVHCGWLFVDRSRAGRRRWCSMADCGNRAKVHRFYRKRSSRRPEQRARA
ncbi:MAG TPA: ABATE domain-containing protein [Candidatus Acidoferrales bacterium]|nr:ABATE domain-containing protein [Candidatus Acidoferrales bacterium]